MDGRSVPLYQSLAEPLATALGLPASDHWESLDQVVYSYLQTPGSRREMLYRRFRAVLTEQPPPVPAALRKLASMAHFDLYVTTTVDSLLQQALDESRFEGRAQTLAVAYTLNEVADLPDDAVPVTRPTVFYLFGRASSQPNYALTQEDTLEFVHSLQSDTRRPQLLFDELRSKHLLLLGNAYPDWLARFFIRTVRSERLTVPGDREAILAGDNLSQDRDLTVFLSSPLSYGTRVYPDGGAVEFVDELFTRWERLHPPSEAAGRPNAITGAHSPIEMPSGAVFISYASEDTERAAELKTLLESRGLDVWLDRGRLEAGDDYDLQIRRHIGRCSLFLPLVSRHTEARMEGYFRREWHYAVDRAQNMDASVPFILPVTMDPVPVDQAHVPEYFRSRHWTRWGDQGLPEEFLERLVALVRDYRRRERGVATGVSA